MKTKRFLALLLVLAMFVTVLASCAKKEDDNSGKTDEEVSGYMNPVGEYPIVKNEITLKIMGMKDPGAKDWDQLQIFKDLQEITGIKLVFDLYDKETFKDQLNLVMLGESDLPDIILRGGVEGIVALEESYGKQGLFMDLTSLIDKYGPNIKKLFNDNKEVKASSTAMDGKIYGLPYVVDTAMTQGHLGFFDEQWMKNVGITKVPETVEEVYDMLKLFKEKDANGDGDPNNEIPLSTVGLNSVIQRLFIPAFTGTAAGLAWDLDASGKPVYVPAMDTYKDFLKYMRKLYAEGLLDPEFATHTSQQWLAKVSSGTVGIYSASPTALDAEKTTTQQLSLPPLTSSTNSKKIVLDPLTIYPARGMLTKNCKYPEAAMRMLDMFYAEQKDAVEGKISGISLFAGYENVHWKYTDDTKEAYEWIAPVKSFADINASVSVNMELPSYANFVVKPVGNPLMDMKVTQVAKMQRPYYASAYPANARFSETDSSEGNRIENDLFIAATQWTTEFINGNKDIDKHYNDYMKELESLGLSNLQKIKEKALENWNAALK